MPAVTSWSCLLPSEKELREFFEDSAFWTEVEDQDSQMMATTRPVFLYIHFSQPEYTKIRWGTNVIEGSDLSLCWKSTKRRKLEIRRRFFRTTLVKLKDGLMKSWIPIDGDLYYRKDAEVQRPTQDRNLADET